MKQSLLLKRLLACLYELLILMAIWMLATLIFIGVMGDASHGLPRLYLQFFLWIITGVYFVVFWVKSGQTLAMKTWKLKIVNENGHLLTLGHACVRYLLASALTALGGLTIIWTLFDKRRFFLHDRLLKNQCISSD